MNADDPDVQFFGRACTQAKECSDGQEYSDAVRGARNRLSIDGERHVASLRPLRLGRQAPRLELVWRQRLAFCSMFSGFLARETKGGNRVWFNICRPRQTISKPPI